MMIQVDGRTLAYDDEGHGPAVVLLHAFPLNRSMWDKTRSALSDRYRVIVPDLRGFGASSVAAQATMSDMADDVLALLDRLGVERAIIGGLSMGGYVALNLVGRHPERVAGLILADTRAGADSDEARQNRAIMAQQALDHGAGSVADQLIPRLFAPATHTEQTAVVDAVRAMIERTDPAALAAALHGMAQRADSTNLLPQITVPTLVLVGKDDALTPPDESETLRRAIPNAVAEVLPNAGHLSNLEQPTRFNHAVRTFLEDIGDRNQ